MFLQSPVHYAYVEYLEYILALASEYWTHSHLLFVCNFTKSFSNNRHFKRKKLIPLLLLPSLTSEPSPLFLYIHLHTALKRLTTLIFQNHFRYSALLSNFG